MNRTAKLAAAVVATGAAVLTGSAAANAATPTVDHVRIVVYPCAPQLHSFTLGRFPAFGPRAVRTFASAVQYGDTHHGEQGLLDVIVKRDGRIVGGADWREARCHR